MAITNNNVQNVKFLRNGTVYGTYALALNALKSFQITAEQDGTAILARYNSTENEQPVVKTLVGWVYKNGNTEYITIQDVEGASGDVEALEKEIKDILGTGVSSGEGKTVSEQLAALSGGTYTPGTSSSANTSVEGAKAYAKDYTDAEIDKLAYTGVTTGTGVYVTNVTEADGIISATTATLPTVDDTAKAKKFVIAIDETLGQISVERGEITSSGKTIVLTDNADGGVNFEVNIDGESIVKDAETGVLSVASAALTQYVGDKKTIHISDADAQNNKTVSTLLTISATTASEANVKEQYNLVNASGETIGATIKIYKDSALVNFYLGHIGDKLTDENQSTHESPTTGITTGTGDTALVYVMQLANGNYKLTAVNVESFLEESEFADGLSVANHVVKVSADTTSEKVITEYNNDGTSATTADVLTVSASGVKVDNIQAAINAKIGTLDATVNNNANSGHVAVEITEVDGKLTNVTVTEDGIASQDKLDELSGKTFTVATSSNASITTAVTAAAADGTKSVDLITDASKIKMTGFTAAAESGLTAITSASTVTEAVKAIETEMIANEQTTATALNDLNTRVNTVSGDVDTIKTNYVSGVSVNGTAVTVANHVAPISITAATSATTAQTANAIVVKTGNDGAITLGLNYIDCGTYDINNE